MTANGKLNRGPNEASTYRALAALTAPDDGVVALPVPKRTEFCCDTLTLSFPSMTEAAAWASRLDATRVEYRLPMGPRLVYSSWVGSWRGFALLITSTEAPILAPAPAAVAEAVHLINHEAARLPGQVGS